MNKLFLSEAIRENPLWRKQKITAGEETVRATVIGAGNCSMEVSGSTIYAKKCGVSCEKSPVQKVYCRNEEEIASIDQQLEIFENVMIPMIFKLNLQKH